MPLRDDERDRCMKRALRLLARRLYSRRALAVRLERGGFEPRTVGAVIAELQRLGYVDDARLARDMAQAAAQRRRLGPRRALLLLRRAGIGPLESHRAVEAAYAGGAAAEAARSLAERLAERLRKLPAVVARRRLAAMLLRRGFDMDIVEPVINEIPADDAGD